MKKLFGVGLVLTTIFLGGCNDSSDSSDQNESSSGAPLTLQTYSPGADGIFAVASTVISGEKDAILVDAQFQNKYAKEVVDLIKKSGKNLKYIYISHSDPDYYFGTNEILKAFPNAKVVSTAQTAYLISASKDDKLAVWKDQLAADAPEKIIIPEALNEGYLELDGKRVEVQLDPEDTAHSFLWIPSLKTVLGGISVSYDSHLWMADTNGAEGIDQWIKQIEKIKALNPEKVIPGHYVKSDFSPKPLDWIKEYLVNFKTAIGQYKTSGEIIQFMDKAYPNLEDRPTLEMSAQVFTKEIDWKVAAPYPVIGQTVTIDFDSVKFDLDFKDNKNMSFVGAGGSVGLETNDKVVYTPVEIAKNVFMVYWHEDKSGDNVVHVQDYNRDLVYTNIASKDSSFTHLQGKITGVKGVIQDSSQQGTLTDPFFALGQTLNADFGDAKYTLQFKDGKNLVVTSTTAPIQTANVEYVAKQVAANVFMVYWTEPSTKRNVVQIFDNANKVIYQNIAQADGAFIHLKGQFSANP
ncbi:MBL fold metallo-hydrolase [Acinetobacter shaoyimingii]|uniref:MBL fold metallo-hydrolase n=1 Tax=Acinetobacter shaoyimingii TaxID=2715164 RepID=A0A6G8RSU3_9GAMM|nr:MBL fold metallo-hydrolase [Acinetobacter shaoyimingii]QIO04890.1 MBL fold metallo-hydrolase [Acinetobacter shaoyimingii]